MQHSVFHVGAVGDAIGQEELNAFLRSHKVLNVRTEFVSEGRNSFWAFDVEWQDGAVPAGGGAWRFGGKEKVDYRNVLDEAQFERFRKMREARKRIAEADAIPAYAVFVDEQLAELAKIASPLDETILRKVNGIGEKKVEKFGARFLALLREEGVTPPVEPE